MYPTKKLWEICENKKLVVGNVKTQNYLHEWKFPIIDQWKNFISWYSNDKNLVFQENFPVLIYWDHTNIVKYIDFPFITWADGIKILYFSNKIDTKFIYYAILCLKPENQWYRRHFPLLKQIEIPLPPLSIQKLIVEKLDAIFAEIEKSKNLLEKNLQNIEEMNKSILEKIFANDEWERKKLGEVCEILLWWTPARDEKDFWWWENLWCSIADMKTKIISDTKEKITDEGVKNSNVKLLKQGTLFISFKLSIWKLAFAGKDLFTNEAIAWLPINDENILNKEFLYYVLLWYDFSRQWSDNSVKGATINKAKLINLEIPLPPLETQKNIVSYLDNIFAENQKFKNLYQAQIKNLDEMKQSFLKKAFAGELV